MRIPHLLRLPAWRRALALAAGLTLLVAAAAPAGARNINANNAYTVHNLVSNMPGVAPVTDPKLVNGWGITASSTSPWWVSDNGTDSSTLYNGAGAKLGLEVDVASAPTGTVFNVDPNTNDFNLAPLIPARFLFGTERGTILGWNPAVDPTVAQLAFTADDGAIYKGLAIASDSDGNFHLYATDFHNAKVDVFDTTFTRAPADGSFVDPGIPAGFAPFGIQTLNGKIYVTYAMQDADAEDEIAGEGLGYVSAFNTDGDFLGRVASGGDLNAPWGLAWAPDGFGRFSGNLLVGNFGDGMINGFGPTDSGWEERGHLKGPDHRAISIDGLWGIGFGNGANSGPVTTLYFAAGPNDEEDGLFGSITSAP